MTYRKNTLTAAVLVLCLPLTSCETLNQIAPIINNIPGYIPGSGPGQSIFPGNGGRGNSTATIFTVVITLAVIAYAASQQQQKLAQQSVARRSSQVKRAPTRYVAVAVPKKSGKGKDMIIVDKETKQPVNQKAYELKPGQTAKAGQTIKVGSFLGGGVYEATALDTVHGV